MSTIQLPGIVPPTALLSANNLSDITTAATARTNLGLGTAATQASTIFAQVANNLSDLASVASALANLGIPNLRVIRTNVNLKSGSGTILYQPASGNFIPLMIVPVLNTVSALIVAGTGSIGTNGGTEFIAATVMPSVAGKILTLAAPATIVSSYTNAAPLYYNPTVAATATTLTADFYIIGLLI